MQYLYGYVDVFLIAIVLFLDSNHLKNNSGNTTPDCIYASKQGQVQKFFEIDLLTFI